MTERYNQEDSSGVVLLENGTDTYRLDFPIFVKDENIHITEVKDRLLIKIKNIVENIELTESINKFKGFVKTATQYIVSTEETNNKKTREYTYVLEDNSNDALLLENGSGFYRQDYLFKNINESLIIGETSNRIYTILKNISETILLTVATDKIKGFVKVATQYIVAFEEAINKIATDVNSYSLESGAGNYLQETGTGYYRLDQIVILQLINSTILGISEGLSKASGEVKTKTDHVNVVETMNRARIMFRNLSSTVGITEASNRLGGLIRIFSNTIETTESFNRLMGRVRNISSTIGLTYSNNHLKGLSRTVNEILGLVENIPNIITGIVKEAIDIVGLSDLINRIRQVFIQTI